MPRTFTPDEIAALSRKLIRAFESMLMKHSFKLNQLVRWKEGLKNKPVPEYNEPAIVWEILPNPVFDNAKAQGAGSRYMNEPLDIVLGVMDEGEFYLLHYDSRRLEPMPQ